MILFRNGVMKDVNIIYISRKIQITDFEIVINQIAVVNMYAPAGSQEKMSFFMNLLMRLRIITLIIS